MSDLLSIARECRGYMSEPELQWLHDTAKGLPLVIEFGSWCGRSSVAMASAQKLVCVDTWLGSPGEECEQDVIAGRINPRGEWLANAALARDAVGRLPECFVGDLSSSVDVDRLVSSFAGLASMVFIDASHDQVSVMRDIATARRLLDAGGILCGHDYAEGVGSWPGVKAAVDATVRAPVVVAGSIWMESR